ncbi:TolC family protein [Aeoliella sp.]|uniref:TolC family protein n=1 Tax=Aeoliella sp. TaxID=2795800 RepID=UPI003CCBC83F
MAKQLLLMIALGVAAGGCRSPRQQFACNPAPIHAASNPPVEETEEAEVTQASYEDEPAAASAGEKAGPKLQQPRELSTEIIETPPPEPQANSDPSVLAIITSVRNHFPAVRQAEASRIIASGEQLSAWGAFDRKLDGYSNAQPLDYYENNWHKYTIKRDTMWGGQVGAGYKIGRGSFEPWYKERETNDGGEFQLSLFAPIGRDWAIDANRAALWRAQLEQNRVEPFIRSQLILSVRDGLQAYWMWVAAGENLKIAEGLLKLGVDRATYLKRQVELGEKAEIDIVDNRRIIVSREAKLTAAKQKLTQAAAKLSLYFRDDSGMPLLVDDRLESSFPEIRVPEEATLGQDLELAISNRPELAELEIVRRQLAVDSRQAVNETRADVDAGIFVAQDVGAPTKDDDKSELELNAIATLSVPLERRKALGKVRQVRGKQAQLRAKTQFAEDKIVVEVQVARAAVIAAAERVEQNRESVELAQRMQEAENRLYEEGQSTLFQLNLREQQRAEAAADLVAAKRDFFTALAEYTAALGLDGGDLVSIYQGIADQL